MQPAVAAGLPLQPTRLIGRERELEVLTGLLRSDARLVTITGAGGVGKTRLALAVAQQLADRFADGLYLIDLSPLSDPGLVPQTAAGSIGLMLDHGRPVGGQIAEYIGSRSMLLIFDNFEHLLPGASLVAELLGTCPGLKIVATSREPLGLQWERQWPLAPLELPGVDAPLGIADLAANPAVTLFVDRVRAVHPGFMLNDDSTAIVAEICVRLDGLPLAIELAAPHVKATTPREILANLGHRLDLLTRGSRDRPRRHQTLREAIAWSYDLLDESGRSLFRSLGVFAGGCTAEAAEAVWQPSPPDTETRERMAALVEKHLLRHIEQPDGSSRYHMLETLREYALERLESSNDSYEVHRRQGEYLLALAKENAGRDSPGRTRFGAGLSRIDAEVDNIRAFLGWCIAAGEVETGLELGAQLQEYWTPRGWGREGRQWLGALLEAAPEEAPARGEALAAAGSLAYQTGDYAEAGTLLEESLSIARRSGDIRRAESVLRSLGRLADIQGDPVRAAELADECIAILREVGDVVNLSIALRDRAVLYYEQRALEQAGSIYAECLELARKAGAPHEIAHGLRGLAQVARSSGDLNRAGSLYRESLRLVHDLGDRRCTASTLEGLACTAYRFGAAERAARLFGSAEGLRDVMGIMMTSVERADHADTVPHLRAMLNEARFIAAWAEGRALDWRDAVRYALEPAGPHNEASAGERDPLTRREQEIAGLIAKGLTNREIAGLLVIAETTAERHVANIFNKLGMSSRVQLAVWASERGLGC